MRLTIIPFWTKIILFQGRLDKNLNDYYNISALRIMASKPENENA